MRNIITLSAKCSDLFTISGNIDGKNIFYDGYVPNQFGTYGDYLMITIDTDTMEILYVGDTEVIDGKLTGISKDDIIMLDNKERVE